MSNNRRTATITRTIVQADGTKTYEKFGAIISSQFPGVYSLIEEVETGETGENGYPERSQIVARKAANGTKVIDSPREDGSRVFYNITVWEDMAAKPSN